MDINIIIKQYGNFLTIKEVAKLLKVHSNTIKNLTMRGDLKATKIGKAVRYEAQAIMDYIKLH